MEACCTNIKMIMVVGMAKLEFDNGGSWLYSICNILVITGSQISGVARVKIL